MEEEKNLNPNEEATKKDPVKSSSKKSSSKEEPKSAGAKFTHWLSELKGEFKKIIWPSKNELLKETVTVIFTSLVIGVVIVGFDQVFHFAYSLFVRLVG